MSSPIDRFSPELCAGAFMRTAQYIAGILSGADLLLEARQILKTTFAADFVAFLPRHRDGQLLALIEAPSNAHATILSAVDQVRDNGFMAIEETQTPHPAVWVLLPVTVEGQLETTMMVGYADQQMPPPHLLEALLGVAAIIGSTLARQRTELELQDSVNRTRLILQAVGEGVCGVDGEGIVTFANKAALEIIGKSEGSLVGRPAAELIASGQAFSVTAETAGVKCQTTLQRHDGSSFPADVVCLPTISDGKVTGLVATFADISERKEAEEKLRQSLDYLARTNTELERFAYVASHDLQEPVRSVVAFSQLLERRLGERLNEDEREFLAFIVGSAKRMSDLVKDLLTYARMTNRQTIHGPVELSGVAQDVCDNLRSLIDERQAVLQIDPLPNVQGNRIQLIELFQNLISNAIKFSRPGITPEIHIKADRDGPLWRLSVQDNGMGIEPEYFERIFIIFQRLHGGQSYSGTGIGLAICKRIVEQHGGNIWVESQLNVGSTFFLTLPEASKDSQDIPPFSYHSH